MATVFWLPHSPSAAFGMYLVLKLRPLNEFVWSGCAYRALLRRSLAIASANPFPSSKSFSAPPSFPRALYTLSRTCFLWAQVEVALVSGVESRLRLETAAILRIPVIPAQDALAILDARLSSWVDEQHTNPHSPSVSVPVLLSGFRPRSAPVLARVPLKTDASLATATDSSSATATTTPISRSKHPRNRGCTALRTFPLFSTRLQVSLDWASASGTRGLERKCRTRYHHAVSSSLGDLGVPAIFALPAVSESAPTATRSSPGAPELKKRWLGDRAVSAASLGRTSAVQLRAVADSTQPPDPCNSVCESSNTYLSTTCAGLDGGDFATCACTETFTRIQEACSRCELGNSANSTQLPSDTISVQKEFGELQAACKKDGKSLPDMDLDNIPLFTHPISFTFDMPQSIDDPAFPDFISAVCLRPDQITIFQCFVGDVNWIRCPNGDVAGILVRVSAYLANLLLGIIVMYHPAESSTAVWTQLLTVYSLLISGIIATGQSSLTRFHSEMTITLVMSPLSSTLVVYSILGFLGRSHRLDSILSHRREHLLPRLLVLVFATISLALVIFTNAATTKHFSENPCELDSVYRSVSGLLRNLLFIPYAGVVVSLISFSSGDVGGVLVLLSPFIVLVVAFVYAVVKQRHWLVKRFQIQNNRWKIWVAWDSLAVQYPFLHFYGVFFIPMLYWILVIESQLSGTPDNLFSLTFGQILAMFVVLPPLLQVVLMIPKAKPWFLNLTVVRLITRRPLAPSQVTPFSLEDGIPEKDSSLVDDPFKDPVPSPGHVSAVKER
ncbi:hypothetical protein B0H17DRAFT_1333284 [Mycena rosella]|uniref:Uncharacterized protein n=1 Tax=Mycena rosella TaxID=1033263 RepID=A0AAD7D979_MYCRO|nr:hypothetical protein B0H17DRAFT_1333284 [Mycena rosella]